MDNILENHEMPPDWQVALVNSGDGNIIAVMPEKTLSPGRWQVTEWRFPATELNNLRIVLAGAPKAGRFRRLDRQCGNNVRIKGDLIFDSVSCTTVSVAIAQGVVDNWTPDISEAM